MVIENSSVEDNDNNKVTLAEAERYKKIMQISSTKSTHNTDVCSDSHSSSDSDGCSDASAL